MITLKEFMEVILYKITDGSEYGWQCYGNNAYMINSWNNLQAGYDAEVIFDRITQEVFELSIHDFANRRSYRIFNPSYLAAHTAECKQRNVVDKAYDDVCFVDLELVEDWVEKATAIVAGKDYDTRIMVPLTLADDHILLLYQLAHEADMTLNDFVCKILVDYIDQQSAKDIPVAVKAVKPDSKKKKKKK